MKLLQVSKISEEWDGTTEKLAWMTAGLGPLLSGHILCELDCKVSNRLVVAPAYQESEDSPPKRLISDLR